MIGFYPDMRHSPHPASMATPGSGGFNVTRSSSASSIILLILLLLLVKETDSRAAEDKTAHAASFQTSVTEISDLIFKWYGEKGYQVESRSLDMGRVVITVAKTHPPLEIYLTPDSPVGVRTTWGRPLEDPLVKPIIQEIHAYLEGTTFFEHQPPGESGSLPEAVLKKSSAVVCIRSSLAVDANRFSGFIIDPAGIILTTAHGLKSLSRVTLFYPDGSQVSGRVVRIDFRRDLALIQADQGSNGMESISLTEGRNFPEMGERLYGAGCAGEGGATLYSGIMEGSPVKVNGILLFQVHMPIHPGNSGSPVFDRKGRLVAMVKARFKGSDSIGFLIPLRILTGFLAEERR